MTATMFLFDHVVTRFGYPRALIRDKGTHFVNIVIEKMIEEFQIQHKKTPTYHPQDNGIIESFNKILEHALTKICNANRDDWNHKYLQYYGFIEQHVRISQEILPLD